MPERSLKVRAEALMDKLRDTKDPKNVELKEKLLTAKWEDLPALLVPEEIYLPDDLEEIRTMLIEHYSKTASTYWNWKK